jgi:Cof subfamily protein (haloacid dehalogenase superfamily)
MKISALISDVDGTLVTTDKTLTAATRAAVLELQARGIAFAIISGRPPRGMRFFVEPLGLTQPIGGFNGGLISRPDLAPVEGHTLAPQTARQAQAILADRGVDVWVFSGLDWLLTNPAGPHVGLEEHTVKFPPTVVPSVAAALASAYKVVGVSGDHELLKRCEGEMRAALGDGASVSRSQPYYLDVTHPLANKGAAVRHMAALMGVPMEEVAVIGDNYNDISMFAQTGFSIAMGNAPDDVKKKARFVTGSNDADGLAAAIHSYILAR